MEYEHVDTVDENTVSEMTEEQFDTENWFATPGDIDDFVFYENFNKVYSER